MKSRWQTIEPLPPIRHDPEFDTAIQSLQEPFLCFLPMEDYKLVTLELVAGQWLVWLHWVIKKKWQKKHKIPVPRGYASLYEPRGEYLYRILELCLQCHSTKWGSSYDNAAHWFSCLIEAERNIELNRASIERLADDPRNGNQRSFQDYHQQKINCLAGLKNPYDPELELHHYQLMQAAIKFTGPSDIFYKNYWRPYLRAYRAWNRSLNCENWHAAWLQDGKLKIQVGRGKGTKTISLPTQ